MRVAYALALAALAAASAACAQDAGQDAGPANGALSRIQLQGLAAQVTPHWELHCDLPGANDLNIAVRVTIDDQGRLVGRPRLVGKPGDAVWRATADGVVRAIVNAAPFDMPPGYEQQEIPFVFRTAAMCGSR